MKKLVTKGSKVLVAALMMVVVMGAAIPVNAASAEVQIQVNATDMNTSVTVPTQLPIIFNEDGTNTYPENWIIKNESSIARIYLEEINLDASDSGWKILESGKDVTKLTADTKEIQFAVDAPQYFKYAEPEGSNVGTKANIQYSVNDIVLEPQKTATLGFVVQRGAFTESIDMQKAFDMELVFKFK